MSGKPRKEKIIVELGKTHKPIVDKFMPWFGNTTGEVLVNLSLRWIEAHVADAKNLNTLEHLGAFTKVIPAKRIITKKPATVPATTPAEDAGIFSKKPKFLRLGYHTPADKKATPIGVKPKRTEKKSTKKKIVPPKKGHKKDSKSSYGT